MKKFWIIFLTVVVFIVVVLGILLIVASFTSKQNFTEKNYSSNEQKISAINIEVEDREVEVSESTDGQIHINYYESEKEYYSIDVNENNELIVKLLYNKNWLDYFGLKPDISFRKINLQVPNNLLNSIQITTTNETIKLNNISVTQNITLNSNGGNVEFENISVGEQISLTAKNGDITGSIIGSLDDFSISCTVKNGECNLPEDYKGGPKSLIVGCNNGDINIDFV